MSQDTSVPFGDPGSYLYTVISYHDLLRSGDLGGLLGSSGYYPPATFVTGALATFVGGVNADAPIIGENVLYVSLLALGCYGTGLLVAGPMAGFLATLFALGSPLLIAQLHVFMIDAPMAGMVAASVWLILLSDRFSRTGVAAAAGLSLGLGIASKEQFPLFVAGLIAVVLVRERGWRNWRGIAVFAGFATVVAAPWYVHNFSALGHYASAGLAEANLPPRARPPLLSISNLGWYLWATLNALLFAPLFAFAAVGVVRSARATMVRRGRRDPRPRGLRPYEPELLGGLLGGWLAITLTPHHDLRYTLPLLVYLAVLGTCWIPALRGAKRTLALAALAAAVLASTLGTTFGVGDRVHLHLRGVQVETDTGFGIPPPDGVTLYSDRGYKVSAPRDDDDVLGLLRRLRRDGVTGIAWRQQDAPVGDPVFDSQGVSLFARFAGLDRPRFWRVRFVRHMSAAGLPDEWNVADPRHAFLIRGQSYAGAPRCVTLSDGTGIWFVVGDPAHPAGRLRCPV